MPSDTCDSASNSLLWHVSLSPEHDETVVLLHGLAGSHHSWLDTGVANLLSKQYHVLVPDLPSHTNSLHLGPATLENTKDRIAELVRQAAHNGKAHIVGFSFGGYAALVLAQAVPELVLSLFLSGVYDMATGRGWQLYLAAPLSFIERNLIPSSVIRKIQQNMGLNLSENDYRESEKNSRNPAVSKAGWNDIKTLQLPPRGDAKRWELPSRTLLIGAARPMHDPVDATLQLGRTLAKGNPESKTALLPDMPHPWMYPAPELFADTVQAWIRREKLPEILQVQGL